MRVICPSCAASVPASDVNLTSMAAKCRTCDSVFGLTNLPQPIARPPRERPPLPRGVSIEGGEPPLPDEGDYRRAPSQQLGELVVKRRWFHWTVLFMTAFVVFWDGFLVNWYFNAHGIATASGGSFISFFAFPLLHVAVGVGLTYWVLATWINVTTLRVNDATLSVKHGPLPWFGSRTVPTATIRQLFVRKRVRRSRNGTTTTWELHAETDDLASLKLISGARDLLQIEYIEWVVEQHLGIVDEPSRNEG